MDSKNNLIYFNNNKTTPVDKVVAEKMHAFNKNGSSSAQELEKADQSICRLLNCEANEFLYTKGTSESIALALKAVFEEYRDQAVHFISSPSEHPAVLTTLKDLQKKGAIVSYLKIDREGLIDMDELSGMIQANTRLVSIMAANNETGVIQPLEAISALCKKNTILFFSDASQYVGKMRCEMDELGIDLMAFGAHKMYGPEGIGLLYVNAKYQNLLKKIKSNYSNGIDLDLIIGFGVAAELSLANYWDSGAHISKLKNYLEHQLLDIEGLRINGSTRYRLHNTSNITFPQSLAISELLTEFEFAHNRNKSSHVLEAMGLSAEEIKNSYRFSFGKNNSLEEVKLLAEKILEMTKK